MSGKLVLQAVDRRPQFLGMWTLKGRLCVFMTLVAAFPQTVIHESRKVQCLLWPNLGSRTVTSTK